MSDVARIDDIIRTTRATAIADDIADVRRAQERELRRLGGGPTLDQQREMADIGARYRQLFADLEMTVPQPRGDDRPGDYRIDLLSRLKRFSPSWRDANLTRLARGIDPVERAIVEDARRIASDKTIASFRRPGALREIRRADQAGQESTSFYGDPMSWMASWMSPVICKVEAFVDPVTGRKFLR